MRLLMHDYDEDHYDDDDDDNNDDENNNNEYFTGAVWSISWRTRT